MVMAVPIAIIMTLSMACLTIFMSMTLSMTLSMIRNPIIIITIKALS
jgi:hypothetical protein